MEFVIFDMKVATWEVFALIGVSLAILEVFVSGFVLLPAGIGFLTTALFAPFIDSWAGLFVVLAANLFIVFALFRKYLPDMQDDPSVFTNVEGMVGKECVVMGEISPQNNGYVKLYGDEWQAKTLRDGHFEKGDRVIIVGMDGNKVIVESLEEE